MAKKRDRPWPATEADIAAPVIAWLREEGWGVHQEVRVHGGGNVADIVAVNAGLIWAIEVKRSLSFAVMEQAWEWSDYAHRVSVAVPRKEQRHYGRNKGSRLQEWVMRKLGVGLLIVTNPVWSKAPRVEEAVPCTKMRIKRLRAKDRGVFIQDMRRALANHEPDFAAAGTPSGKVWSPFQGTVRAAVSYVKHRPGCTLKELVEGIDHHYASDSGARQCLSRYVQTGVIKELRIDWDVRPAKVYPAD